MKSEEYIKERVDGQIEWYDNNSQRAQKWFKRFRVLEIISAGSIPLFAGFGAGSNWSTIVVGVLGAVAATLAALLIGMGSSLLLTFRECCQSG